MTVAKGRLGENLAVTYLEELGYRILERNFRYSRIGEIDIMAQEGDEVVFVEVKLTSTAFLEFPEEQITETKINRLRQTAEYWLQLNEDDEIDCRFDVLAISEKAGKYDYHHFENAF
jgi:putative endonuclease